MTARTYGAIERTDNGWTVTEIEPHVAIAGKGLDPCLRPAASPAELGALIGGQASLFGADA